MRRRRGEGEREGEEEGEREERSEGEGEIYICCSGTNGASIGGAVAPKLGG